MRIDRQTVHTMLRQALLLLATLTATATGAQTVVWQVAPAAYSGITRLGSNLFEVTQGDKVGLMRADGSVLLAPANNHIGGYYDNRALVTRSDSHGELIAGWLSKDGDYTPFTTPYYTITAQNFFSDGLLTVTDANGQPGYIDTHGNKVLGFDGKYNRIKPFTEGYAAVRKGKKYVLIDKEGTEQTFHYGGNGIGAAIGGCTNVYNDVAYVYDEYGGSDRTYFTYNARQKSALQKARRIKSTDKDYLYCYQEVTHRPAEVPFEKATPYAGQKGLSPTPNGSLYGYTSGDGHVVLPPQLESATPFNDGLAIVGLGGKKGILKYVADGQFSTTESQAAHTFYAGDQVTCKFTLSVPTAWQGKTLDVTLTDASGSPVTIASQGQAWQFTLHPTATGKRSYKVTASGDGLTLYEGTLAYSFTRKEREVIHKETPVSKPRQEEKPVSKPQRKEPLCPTCGLPISKCPYKGVH